MLNDYHPGYYLDSMKQDNKPCTKVYVLPRFAFQTLSRTSGLSSILDFSVYKKHFSLEDIAFINLFHLLGNEWCPTGDEGDVKRKMPKCFGCVDQLWDYDFVKRASADDRTSHAYVVDAVHGSDAYTRLYDYLKPRKKDGEEAICEVVDGFNSFFGPSDVGSDYDKRDPNLKYQIVPHQGTLFIVLDEEFLDDLQSHVFLKDVLKGLYALDRVDNVNQTEWYRLYVASLGSQV